MIRACLLYTVVLILGIFLQGSLIGSTIPAAIVPDVLVVLAVYVALTSRTVLGLVGVFLLGIVADLAGGVYVGPNAAGAVAAFVVTGILANRVYAERIFAIVIISFVCSIVKSLVIALLLWRYTTFEIALVPLVQKIIFEAAATGFVAPIFVRLLQLGYSLRTGGTAVRRAGGQSTTGTLSSRKSGGSTGTWRASSR